VADVASGSVLVVGDALDDDSHAVRTVALIDHVLVVVLVLAAGSLLDDALDVVVGDVVGVSLGDEVTELGVVVGVGTALLDNDGDLAADLGEDLALYSICCFLLALDIVPC
jgi:hypothetical protein